MRHHCTLFCREIGLVRVGVGLGLVGRVRVRGKVRAGVIPNVCAIIARCSAETKRK